MSWFKTGYESTKTAYDDLPSSGPRRVWMPAEATNRFIFLEDDPTCFWEHQFQVNDDWKNWEPCFPAGAIVQTARGVVPIEEVVEGDVVVTHMGNHRPVIDVMTRMYQRDMVRVNLPKLPPLVATGNHGIYGVRQPGTGSGRIGRHRVLLDEMVPHKIEARDLRAGDYVWVPSERREEASEISEDLAWLIGLYAADGSGHGGVFFITLGLDERDLAERAIKVLREELRFDARIFEQHNCLRVYRSSKDLCCLFNNWCGVGSANKHLPDAIMHCRNEKVLQAAAQGFVDGDGYSDEYHVTAATISATMASQLHQIWSALGYTPAIRHSKREKPRQDIYVVQRPVMGRQYSAHNRGDGTYLKVKDVESWQANEPVFNIEVDGDHSYTVGMVGVSNCKRRNHMENVCAICDRFPDRQASYVGYHSVISLTPWTDDKGRTWCFGRQMYGAKLGGKDKPGVLKKLERIKQKYGRIRGLVIDCYRSGSKAESVGDDLEVVEKVEPDAVVAWVKAQLPAHIEQMNAGRDDDKQMTIERFLKFNPIEPFNFEEVIKPRSNAELLTMLGGPSSSKSSSGGGGQQQGNGGGQSDHSALDEDIPY